MFFVDQTKTFDPINIDALGMVVKKRDKILNVIISFRQMDAAVLLDK